MVSALGGLSKDSGTLRRRLGRSYQGDRVCGTSSLMYNAGSNLRLFRSDFHNQRNGDTFKGIL